MNQLRSIRNRYLKEELKQLDRKINNIGFAQKKFNEKTMPKIKITLALIIIWLMCLSMALIKGN